MPEQKQKTDWDNLNLRDVFAGEQLRVRGQWASFLNRTLGPRTPRDTTPAPNGPEKKL